MKKTKKKSPASYQAGGVMMSGMMNSLNNLTSPVALVNAASTAAGMGGFDPNFQGQSTEKNNPLSGIISSISGALGNVALPGLGGPLATIGTSLLMNQLTKPAPTEYKPIRENSSPYGPKAMQDGGRINSPIYDQIWTIARRMRPGASDEDLRPIVDGVFETAYANNYPVKDLMAQLHLESRLRHFDDKGNLVKSPTGPEGIGQFTKHMQRHYNIDMSSPYSATVAAGDNMARILEQNAKQGYATGNFEKDLDLAEQRYNQGGPNFRAAKAGKKQIKEMEDYPVLADKRKRQYMSDLPDLDFTYFGKNLPEVSVTAFRNDAVVPRESTRVAQNLPIQKKAEGGDLQLSPDAIQVKGDPTERDGELRQIGGEKFYLDHNEVISQRPDSSVFAYSDVLKNPRTGNTFAKDAAKLEMAKGKASKPQKMDDPHAAKTREIVDKILTQLAQDNQIQIALKEAKGDKVKRVTDSRPQSYMYGGKIKSYQDGDYVAPPFWQDPFHAMNNPFQPQNPLTPIKDYFSFYGSAPSDKMKSLVNSELFPYNYVTNVNSTISAKAMQEAKTLMPDLNDVRSAANSLRPVANAFSPLDELARYNQRIAQFGGMAGDAISNLDPNQARGLVENYSPYAYTLDPNNTIQGRAAQETAQLGQTIGNNPITPEAFNPEALVGTNIRGNANLGNPLPGINPQTFDRGALTANSVSLNPRRNPPKSIANADISPIPGQPFPGTQGRRSIGEADISPIPGQPFPEVQTNQTTDPDIFDSDAELRAQFPDLFPVAPPKRGGRAKQPPVAQLGRTGLGTMPSLNKSLSSVTSPGADQRQHDALVEASNNITIVPGKGPTKWEKFSENFMDAMGNVRMGDVLQGAEIFSKFLDLKKGPEREALQRMPMRQIDDRPYVESARQAFNAQQSNTGTAAFNRSAQQANYANYLGNLTGARHQIASTNKQLANQTDQFNIGQSNRELEINAANRGAWDAARQTAFTTVGNLGRAIHKRNENREAQAMIGEGFNEVFDYFIKDVMARTAKARAGGK